MKREKGTPNKQNYIKVKTLEIKTKYNKLTKISRICEEI